MLFMFHIIIEAYIVIMLYYNRVILKVSIYNLNKQKRGFNAKAFI